MKTYKKQVLNLEDFQKWLLTTEMLYAADGERKLVVLSHGGYRIYYKGEIKWEGMRPSAAIEKYNAL